MYELMLTLSKQYVTSGARRCSGAGGSPYWLEPVAHERQPSATGTFKLSCMGTAALSMSQPCSSLQSLLSVLSADGEKRIGGAPQAR